MRTPAALVASVFVAALACTRPIDSAAIADGGGGFAGGTGAGGNAGAPAKGGTGPVSTCGAALTFLLVGADNQIYAFDPATDASKPLGALSCPEIAGAAVVSAALGADGTVYYLLDNQLILLAKSGAPTVCAPWTKPPAPTAEAIAFNGGKTERLLVATDGKVFATDAPATSSWDILGALPAGEKARALLGTGDGRLFAALSPSIDDSLPIARLDLADASAEATVLVPAPEGAPDDPTGFALYGDELLVFAGKSLVRYSFSTGDVGTPKFLVDIGWPLVAVAAPACASTERP